MSVALTVPIRNKLLFPFTEEDTEVSEESPGHMVESSNAGVRVASVKAHTWQELSQDTKAEVGTGQGEG